MDKEHPLDRFMRHHRRIVGFVAVLSFPIFMISYGWMLKQLLMAAPWWVSVAVVISNLTVVVGLGSLIDSLREQVNLR